MESLIPPAGVAIEYAYALGAVGLAAEWRAYALPARRSFQYWSALGALLWAAQYLCLGAPTAGLTMAATAARTWCAGWQGLALGRGVQAAAFSALFAVLTACSWQGWVSLLPAFAVTNTTLALYFLHNRSMRMALLASSAGWIWNDWYWQAWPALAAESAAVLINLRTIVRLRRDADAA